MAWVRFCGFGIAALIVLAGCPSGSTAPGSSVSNSATNSGNDDTGTTTGVVDDSSTGFDTLMSAEGSGETAAPTIDIDCDDPPPGAVGAEYDHTPIASGAAPPLNWSMVGLPDGMVFSPLNGQISGAPTEQGTFDIEVTVTGGSPEGSQAQTCTIEIGAALGIDLSGITCIAPGDNLLDHLTGGDGSDPVCSTPGGRGNGVIPDGVAVDPTTCEVEGSTSDAYGTWVWIAEVIQSGFILHVPYCFTQDQPDLGAYQIMGDHSGGVDNQLVPAVSTFAPGENLDWGGNADPYFEVHGPCGGSCFFGWAYRVSSSPFGNCGEDDCFGLTPASLLNPGGGPIGFSHEMWAKGDPPEENFEDRIWVLSWDIAYCLGPVDECDTVENIETNGNGELRFGLIMVPQ